MGAIARSIGQCGTFHEVRVHDLCVVMNGMKTAIFLPASKWQVDRVCRPRHGVPGRGAPGAPTLPHHRRGHLRLDPRLAEVRPGACTLHPGSRPTQVAGVVLDSGPSPIFHHGAVKGTIVCPMVSKAVLEGSEVDFQEYM